MLFLYLIFEIDLYKDSLNEKSRSQKPFVRFRN